MSWAESRRVDAISVPTFAGGRTVATCGQCLKGSTERDIDHTSAVGTTDWLLGRTHRERIKARACICGTQAIRTTIRVRRSTGRNDKTAKILDKGKSTTHPISTTLFICQTRSNNGTINRRYYTCTARTSSFSSCAPIAVVAGDRRTHVRSDCTESVRASERGRKGARVGRRNSCWSIPSGRRAL